MLNIFIHWDCQSSFRIYFYYYFICLWLGVQYLFDLTVEYKFGVRTK